MIVSACTANQGKWSSSQILRTDPNDWLVKEHGGGAMIVERKVFGRLFIHALVSQYDDLEFVSRGS